MSPEAKTVGEVSLVTSSVLHTEPGCAARGPELISLTPYRNSKKGGGGPHL